MKRHGTDSSESQRDFNWQDVHQRIAAAEASLAGMGDHAPEWRQEILERRAARLAEAPLREDEDERIELVLIQLGRELYGLDVQYVSDLRPVERVTRVPRVPDWVAGVVNLRGRILSVVDLQRFFGLPRAAERNGDDGPAGTPYLVAVEAPGMEVALLADEVLAVEALPFSRIQEAPGTVRGIRPEYVRGVSERGNGDTSADGDGPMLVVLDLPALLADERLIVHEEII
jgi:purine-binding chemotaxis protein CheW